MKKVTCGPLYLDAIRSHTGGDKQLVRAFAAGFVNGQAEKVYLGACRAAMFRPAPEDYDWLLRTVQQACRRYRMHWISDDMPGGREIWMCRREEDVDLVISLKHGSIEPNSEDWHRVRGFLCGIPTDEIDDRFHERKGYGKETAIGTKEKQNG